MKLNNKILYLTTAGVISTLTPANTNAQTFYQCMPITCKAGEYKENNTCKKCPAGTYNPNTGSLTSADCKPCSAGYYSVTGASSCTTCEAGYACNNGTKTACADGTYATAGQSSCKACNNYKFTNLTIGPTSFCKYIPSYQSDYSFDSKYFGIYTGCDKVTGELLVDLYTDCSSFLNGQFSSVTNDTKITATPDESNGCFGGCYSYACKKNANITKRFK